MTISEKRSINSSGGYPEEHMGSEVVMLVSDSSIISKSSWSSSSGSSLELILSWDPIMVNWEMGMCEICFEEKY